VFSKATHPDVVSTGGTPTSVGNKRKKISGTEVKRHLISKSQGGMLGFQFPLYQGLNPEDKAKKGEKQGSKRDGIRANLQAEAFYVSENSDEVERTG